MQTSENKVDRQDTVRVVDTWIRHNGLISHIRTIGNLEPIIETWQENDAPVVFVYPYADENK